MTWVIVTADEFDNPTAIATDGNGAVILCRSMKEAKAVAEKFSDFTGWSYVPFPTVSPADAGISI